MSDIAGFLTAKQWGVAIFVAFLSLVGVIPSFLSGYVLRSCRLLLASCSPSRSADPHGQHDQWSRCPLPHG